MPETAVNDPSDTATRRGSGPFIVLPWPVDGDDHLCLAVNVSAETVLLNRERPVCLEPGDLVITTAHCPGFLLDGEALAVFRIPFCLLNASAADLREVPPTRLDGRSGLASLVSQFLTALAGTPPHERFSGGRQLALNTADLAALLLDEVLRTHRPERVRVGHDMLTRIQRHIQENLMDPDLTPESIARAHHISVRYLHKLFQPGGTTVGTWIRQRRLDACRDELRRQRRTVAAVAHRWGFTSPSHFSRLFRQTYGLTPREWQAAASSDS